MSGVYPRSEGGAPFTLVRVDGHGYIWTCMGVWGHRPYGDDPILWTCETCGGLTADIPRHNRFHGSTDTEET